MLPRPFRDRNRVSSPFLGGNLWDGFFKSFQDDLMGDSLGRFGSTDIYEKDGYLHYELELPGMNKEDISIQVKGDRLVISGEVSKEDEEKGINFITRGRKYGSFKRSLPLPEEVENPDELKAKFENGVLHLEVKLSRSITEDEAFDAEIE